MNYIAERRQEEKERRRAEILDAAEAVIADGGWDELTMDLVARRARLSRALLYVYFKDKIDLMYGICERGLSALRQQFGVAVASNPRGLDQVIAMSRAYVQFSKDSPVYFDIMARCSLREVNTENAPENELACNAVGDALGAHIVSMITAGIRDGSIRSDLGPRHGHGHHHVGLRPGRDPAGRRPAGGPRASRRGSGADARAGAVADEPRARRQDLTRHPLPRAHAGAPLPGGRATPVHPAPPL